MRLKPHFLYIFVNEDQILRLHFKNNNHPTDMEFWEHCRKGKIQMSSSFCGWNLILFLIFVNEQILRLHFLKLSRRAA